MNDLKIENGQFWRDGKVVPPEFGNWDQILALKKAVGHQEELEEGETGVDVKFTTKQTNEVTFYTYSTEWEFQCLCGRTIGEYYEEKDEQEEWGIEDELNESAAEDFDDDIECKCKTCAREYIISKTPQGVQAILQKATN